MPSASAAAALRAARHIVARLGQRLFHAARPADRGEHRVQPMRMGQLAAGAQTTSNRQYRHAITPGDAGDANRRFALHALAIDTAFAGHRQIGVGQRRVQAHRLGDDGAAGA